MLTYILFVIGFVILTFGANWLVDGASAVARKFNIPSLVIGLTIVAFGTSAPELVVNILASINGNSEIAIGNVVGSNIFNVLVILGIAAVIFPLKVHANTIKKEIPLSLLAAVVLFFVANDALMENRSFNEVSRIDGFVFLAFFGIFLYYTFESALKNPTSESETDVKKMPVWKSILFIMLGLTGLVLGGKWIVDGAVTIADSFGISESVTGLTIVAAGTSLPELATSAVAAYKRNTDIAIGNVVGSNIFNIFLILGVSSIIKPLPLAVGSNIDIGMVIFSSLLLVLFIFVGKGRQISRIEGGAFIVVYLIYLGVLLRPYL